jgi:pimeloyl-ACP methyl ester carboxylesterase
MPNLSRAFLLLPVWVACGCAAFVQEVHAPPALSETRGIVFAADGAGDFHATSLSLCRVVSDCSLPLRVQPFEWSHGFGRIFADQIDHAHARAAGCQLAAQVEAYHRACPEHAIYLVGHSAGSLVVLTAAEALPPGTVERIVLLAPSVSAGYDLRPALCHAREGIDVFYSPRDWWFLGVGTTLVGTADGGWHCPAGRIGFRPLEETPEDGVLYSKLRQHAWHPCVEWAGNHGGHYGGYQPDYLRAYVLPLLAAGR